MSIPYVRRSASSAQKASRNQRMVRPVKKLIDSACAIPGMTWVHANIHLRSVRTCGRLTTRCQKVPPSTAVCPARPTPSPRQPQLHVASAHHHRGVFHAGRSLRGLFSDSAQHGAGLFHRRDIGAAWPYPAALAASRGRRDPASLQCPHLMDRPPARRRASPPAKVADHGNSGSLAIDIRRWCASHSRRGMALRARVWPETSYHWIQNWLSWIFEFGHLAAGGRRRGAAPDGLTVAVIQHNPFAHGAAGDGLGYPPRSGARSSVLWMHWQVSRASWLRRTHRFPATASRSGAATGLTHGQTGLPSRSKITHVRRLSLHLQRCAATHEFVSAVSAGLPGYVRASTARAVVSSVTGH